MAFPRPGPTVPVMRGSRGLSVLCGASLLGGCGGVMDPAGPVAAAQRTLLFNATGIMLVVVIPVIAMTLGFAWWFRAGNKKAAYHPDWEYSGQIELVVWAIPAMVVVLLAGVGWLGAHELDPRKPLVSDAKPMQVQVVSLDWKWLFIYPEQGVATVNQLMVPAGVPIEFQLTSATVMNAFFVPQAGSMIYAMPGMTSHLNLMVDRPGDYPGMSSHFSGDGFSGMRFTVHAMPAAAFEAWAAGARNGGAALDEAALARLQEPGGAEPAIFNSVEADLFDHVIHQSTQPR